MTILKLILPPLHVCRWHAIANAQRGSFQVWCWVVLLAAHAQSQDCQVMENYHAWVGFVLPCQVSETSHDCIIPSLNHIWLANTVVLNVLVCVCVEVRGRTCGSAGMRMRVWVQGREVRRTCLTSGRDH